MATYIRLTDYKSSDKKEQEFFNPENRYEAKQEDFSKITGTPIAYWVSQEMKELFKEDKLSLYADAKVGLQTGDNDLFLKYWHEVKFKGISFMSESLLNKIWLPYNKGGSIRKWFGNNEYIINWSNNGSLIRNHKSAVIRNEKFYLKSGYSWSSLTSGMFNARYTSTGFLFDTKGPTIFTKNKINLLAFVNSKVSNHILKIISPTLDYNPGPISNLPILFTKSDSIKQQIEALTQQNIDISKEEWDSRETSWDFTKNELIKHKQDGSLENSLNAYSTQWAEQFSTLHANEEELNRLFVDIYGLQDELTPDVALEDITILKNEAKIINGQLEFQNDEIIKQFISYAVGCMFGRYSLDEDGLVVANMNQAIPAGTTYEIDDDNIIPIVEESDYFADDITDRFIEFVRTTFGSEKLQQNIAFIEKAIGKKIRDYFMKEFYKDHVSTKRYKKRPIYWLFSSPRGTFQTLIYMHRYTPDTLNHILNDYLRPFRIRLDTMRNEAMRTTEREDISSKEKTDADKKIDKIDKTLDDINEYEKVLAHYAAQRIEIDLDDGVKVNYCKFKELLVEFDKKLCKK
jgi:hypothetical protein